VTNQQLHYDKICLSHSVSHRHVPVVSESTNRVSHKNADNNQTVAQNA